MAKKPQKHESNGAAKPGDRQAPASCYILSLSVENVRCFGPKQTLDFTDGKGNPAQWTIILGENGTGKTTLLQILTSFELLPKSGMIDSKDPKSYSPRIFLYPILLPPPLYPTAPVSISDHQVYSGLPRGDSNNRAVSKLVFRPLDGLRAGASSSVPFDAEWHIDSHCAQGRFGNISPVYNAYGVGRRLRGVLLSQSEKDDPVATLFDDTVPLRNAVDWLLRLDYAAKSTKLPADAARVEQVKHLLISILPDIGDLRFQTTSGPNPRQWVEFQTFSGWVPLRRLGYGYQTLVAWVLDFVSRMVERYPNSPDPLKEPAIVIVDEIDLHLHPAWQRKLIAFLTERFTNTQFIVTAHSPLIVQAVEDANVVVLKRVGDHVEIINDVDEVRGWRVDQILTSNLFGLTSARPPGVEKLFARKEELINKRHLTVREQHELKRLQEKIDRVPVGDSAASVKEFDAIRNALDLLMKNSPP